MQQQYLERKVNLIDNKGINKYLIPLTITPYTTIFFLLIFFSATKCYSQLYFGPVAGPQVSRVAFFDKEVRNGYRSLPFPGFYAGGMVSMKVRDKFFLSGELIYSQKAKLVDGKQENTGYKSKSNLKYIELPIFYTLEFKERTGKFSGKGGLIKQYKWFVGGGPIISYWLGGRGYLQSGFLHENEIDRLRYKIIFNNVNEDLNEEIDGDKMNVEDPNRFQFGLNFTGGVAFEPIGLQRIVAAVHLEIGQTFLSKTSLGYFPATFVDADYLKARYQGFRISLAYLVDTKISERNKGKSTKDKVVKSRKKRW